MGRFPEGGHSTIAPVKRDPSRQYSPRGRGREPAVAPKTNDEVVYGHRAALAVIAKRPADILAIAHAPEHRRELEGALRGRRVPVEEKPEHELARLADSKNHEGLCVRTRPRRFASPTELGELLTKKRGVAIALDRVRNPYNIGAILRTAAFFGVDAALLGSPAPHPALPPDSVRVAEGGAEELVLARTTDLAESLARLRKGSVRVVGADVTATAGAIGFAFERPTVLVVGHEREGMSDRVRAQCDALVKILGTGAVESLNVAVASGILIAEMTR